MIPTAVGCRCRGLWLAVLLLVSVWPGPVHALDLPALRAAAVAPGSDAFTVRAADGATLCLREWRSTREPKAALLVLHGIGFDAAPYRVVADALNPRGIDVYAMDLRGHGLSDGARGFLAPADTQAADVITVLDAIRRRPGASGRLFLLGESLGAIPAQAAAARPDADLAGLVLAAPALEPNPRTWLGPALLGYAILGFLSPRHAVVSLTDTHLLPSTRDPGFVALRRADPLALERISLQYLLQYMADAPRWRKQWSPRIKAPVLLQQGGRDRVVVERRAEEFCRASGRTLIRYPEAYHTLFWDPDTPRLLADLGDWILAPR